MPALKIAVVIGSLRQGSYNRSIAQALMKNSSSNLNFFEVEIGNLPLYNQDLDNDPPKQWVDFREKIKPADAVLFFTPEYNRSIPGVLKNAIDVGSRPYGHSVWDKKPAGIMSVSPGAAGGFGANHHLRQCMTFLNMPCMQQPEAYIGGVQKYLDDKGNVTNEDTLKVIKKFSTAFEEWVMKFKAL